MVCEWLLHWFILQALKFDANVNLNSLEVSQAFRQGTIVMKSFDEEYYENAETLRHRDYIIAQSNCILCGSVLELKHIKANDSVEICEEAYCPNCEVKTRTRIHSIN